jgi:gas vesicle protein
MDIMRRSDTVDKLDELSNESREKLKKQIRRVQEEAHQLRIQARRLRHEQKKETKKQQHLLEHLTQSGKVWSQGMLKRGGDVASSGASMAGAQLRAGQQLARERGSGLVQDLGQRSTQVVNNLGNWRDDATHNLRKRGQSLAHDVAEWREDTAHEMRKQSRNLGRVLSDWGEDMMYKLRKQGRYIARNVAHTRSDATHKLRKQGRYVTRKLRKQSQQLVDRGSSLLEAGGKRGRKVWPILGFVSGVLLAGGITYWLVRRMLSRSEEIEERQYQLAPRERMNSMTNRPAEEIHYAGQGGAAVATKTSTKKTETVEPLENTDLRNRFVGVLSTRRYFPIEQRPDVDDVVFFLTEDDARAEGFTSAF